VMEIITNDAVEAEVPEKSDKDLSTATVGQAIPK